MSRPGARRSVGQLSAREWGLLAVALGALAWSAIGVAFVPFWRLMTSMRTKPAELNTAQIAVAIGEVRWAVRACARRVPWRAKCFEQALAARWMLRQRGVATMLHYGARQLPDGALIAHVWVTAGSADVIGYENKAEFREVSRFPSHGGA